MSPSYAYKKAPCKEGRVKLHSLQKERLAAADNSITIFGRCLHKDAVLGNAAAGYCLQKNTGKFP